MNIPLEITRGSALFFIEVQDGNSSTWEMAYNKSEAEEVIDSHRRVTNGVGRVLSVAVLTEYKINTTLTKIEGEEQS